MIGTVVRISWLNLRRDRVALAMTFLLPLMFFSVFALVFGGTDDDSNRTVRMALAVRERNALTDRLEAIVQGHPGVQIVPSENGDEEASSHALRSMVRGGRVDVAVELPRGFAAKLTRAEPGAAEVRLWINRANPLAAPLAEGLVRSASLVAALESFTSPIATDGKPLSSSLQITREDAFAAAGKRPSVAYFAAGIGVMFLLFSVSGRSGILIEERESGVLTRLMASRLSLRQLLLGRWLFLTMLGFAQVSLMFVWASIAFGLRLWTPQHLIGFVLMTLASAAAASSLGVLLAVSCRSRAQLNGISAVLILIMSALGGSMFPRFLMPEHMQMAGRLTFNAWAVDGYQKVFWYDASPVALVGELVVLCLAGAVFLLLGMRIARARERP